MVNNFEFKCMASRPEGAAGNDSHARSITYIIIELSGLGNSANLRKHVRAADIDWDTFLDTVQRFPHLRQITIQYRGYLESADHIRQMLVEFLAHLGEVWTSRGNLLKIYYGIQKWRGSTFEYDWVQVQLGTLTDEIKQRV